MSELVRVNIDQYPKGHPNPSFSLTSKTITSKLTLYLNGGRVEGKVRLHPLVFPHLPSFQTYPKAQLKINKSIQDGRNPSLQKCIYENVTYKKIIKRKLIFMPAKWNWPSCFSKSHSLYLYARKLKLTFRDCKIFIMS